MNYPTRLNHVVWKVLDGRGILLNLDSGAYFEVNPVGLALWQKCDGKRSSEVIQRSVTREFNADPKRISRDFSVFIAQLSRRRLLKVSETPVRSATRLLKKTR